MKSSRKLNHSGSVTAQYPAPPRAVNTLRARALSYLWPVLVILFIPLTGNVQASVVHEEKSLYRNIVVVERSRAGHRERCLQFSVRRDQRNQSCMDIGNPKRILFSYVQMSFAGLLVNTQPKNVLIVGLGGGTQPTTLRDLYPEASIDIVEIDPAVVRIAKDHFNFRTDTHMHVHTKDARVFIKRALRRNKQYDYVLLDAFTGEYIPEHLMTAEFLNEVKALLTPGGVLVANTFASSRLYHHESATYASVFDTFFNLKSPGSMNRIIIARKGDLPTQENLQARAELLRNAMKAIDVPIERYPKRMKTRQDWNTDARILTDQYAPVNVMR